MFKLQSRANKVHNQTVTNQLITNYFAQFKVLIGQPQYKMSYRGMIKNKGLSGTKIVVQIPYFTPKGIQFILTESKMSTLGVAITNAFHKVNKTDIIEIRLIRLRYPYLDSAILSQFLALNSGKYNFNRLQKTLFNSFPIVTSEAMEHRHLVSSHSLFDKVLSELPTTSVSRSEQLSSPLQVAEQMGNYVTGLKMELAGRLPTQRSVPRKTVENSHTGSFTEVNKGLSSGLDFSQYASKNKLGAFTMKV